MVKDLAINSKSFASIYSSLFLNSKKIDYKFINFNKSSLIYGEYRLPILSLYKKTYKNDIFKFLGVDLSKKNTPLTVIIEGHNFDFYSPWIFDEIIREFNFCEKDFTAFINYIKSLDECYPAFWLYEISFKYKDFLNKIKFNTRTPSCIKKLKNKTMDELYSLYSLPKPVKSLLNAILFVASGVWDEKFPAIYGVRILASALDGVLEFKNSFDFKLELLNLVKDRVDYDYPLDFIKKGPKIELSLLGEKKLETDILIYDLIPNYKKLIPIIYEFKLKSNLISPAMNENVIYVDCDKSYWFDYNRVYIIQKLNLGKETIVRITSFDTHLSEELKGRILKVANKLFIKHEGEFFISKYSDEIILSTDRIKLKCTSHVIESGRFFMPYLGHEGMIINGLNIIDYLSKR